MTVVPVVSIVTVKQAVRKDKLCYWLHWFGILTNKGVSFSKMPLILIKYARLTRQFPPGKSTLGHSMSSQSKQATTKKVYFQATT